MSGSPKYGIESGEATDLEIRIRELENQLASKVPTSSAGAYILNQVSAPTGINLVTNVGNITVNWNTPSETNVTGYEVEVADNEAFANKETFRTSNTFFTYEGGDGTSIYFIRVRAFASTSGAPGPYSATLNTSTGKATSNNLVVGSGTAITTDVTVDFGGEILDTTATNPDTKTWSTLTVSVSGGVLIPYTVFEFYVNTAYSSGDNTLTIDFNRNNKTIDTYSMTFNSDFSGTGGSISGGIMTITSFATADLPGFGNFNYSTDITVDDGGVGGNHIKIEPVRLVVEFIEYVR